MKRVLLVEDEERIARFITKGLLKYGFNLTVVSDGQQALEQVDQDAYDVILLDLGLPLVSGLTVLQTLREQGYSPPIIVITALVDQEEISLAAGATDFIAKPFSFSELLKTINRNTSSE
ncbi:response regulator transcription factor [Acaryochloris sp. IP29b_bin.137]|uniref:response regulator transcription factor n=1 Tax=Acaryochloris sp. IP29b_bin.137 TaxID=2969217 RepID=UPI002611D265|nr:response regulator transcription factor [Acaryochloris sp. IP29b_bin.137]